MYQTRPDEKDLSYGFSLVRKYVSIMLYKFSENSSIYSISIVFHKAFLNDRIRNSQFGQKLC